MLLKLRRKKSPRPFLGARNSLLGARTLLISIRLHDLAIRMNPRHKWR
jgi:hypothetical protein